MTSAPFTPASRTGCSSHIAHNKLNQVTRKFAWKVRTKATMLLLPLLKRPSVTLFAMRMLTFPFIVCIRHVD